MSGDRCMRLAGPLTVFREQIIRPPDNERRDERAELLELFITRLPLRISGVSVATTQDLELEILSKVLTASKILGIGKVEQGKVLGQVVLNRSARQDDAALDVELGEGLERLRIYEEE